MSISLPTISSVWDAALSKTLYGRVFQGTHTKPPAQQGEESRGDRRGGAHGNSIGGQSYSIRKKTIPKSLENIGVSR